MTIFFNDVVNMLDDLNADELAAWIDKGWIKPEKVSESSDVFHATDVARVRLIAECRYQLNLDVDTIDLIIPLLDQVYGLRRELRTLVPDGGYGIVSVRDFPNEELGEYDKELEFEHEIWERL